jgi:hypothetical protein
MLAVVDSGPLYATLDRDDDDHAASIQVITLDHHHFRAVRPKHCAALELLP